MSVAASKPEITQPRLDAIVPHARQLSVSQIIRRLFRMAVLFLAARMLGVETFGTYALLLTIVEMIAVVSGAAYGDFLTREVARRAESAWPLGQRITWLRLAYALPSVVLALLVLAALRFPSSLIANAALLSLTLLPRAAGESAQGLLKGLRHFAPLPWIELVQGAIVLAAAPLFIVRGFAIKGLIGAEILGAAGGAAVSLISIAGHVSFKDSSAPGFRELLRSTFAFNVYPLITSVYDRVDVVLLSKLAGNFATGIYSLPYRAFATLHILPYGVMGALLPAFSASAAGHDSRETCSRAMKFLFLAALSIVLLTLTFAGPAILLLLGKKYAGSIITLKILVWASVPAFLNFALNTLFLSAQREKVFLWTGTVCTVFNISANLLLIPRFSFIAAAAVTVLTECLLLAQNLYLVRKLMGHRVFPKDGLKITVVFVAVLAGFWLLQRSLPLLWAGSLACGVFLIFGFWTASGLRPVRVAVAHEHTK